MAESDLKISDGEMEEITGQIAQKGNIAKPDEQNLKRFLRNEIRNAILSQKRLKQEALKEIDVQNQKRQNKTAEKKDEKRQPSIANSQSGNLSKHAEESDPDKGSQLPKNTKSDNKNISSPSSEKQEEKEKQSQTTDPEAQQPTKEKDLAPPKGSNESELAKTPDSQKEGKESFPEPEKSKEYKTGQETPLKNPLDNKQEDIKKQQSPENNQEDPGHEQKEEIKNKRKLFTSKKEDRNEKESRGSAQKMKKKAEQKVSKATSTILKQAWLNIISSWGCTYFYIPFHFLNRYFTPWGDFFSKFGSEWIPSFKIPTPAQDEKSSSGPKEGFESCLEIIEIIGCIFIGIILALIILILFLILLAGISLVGAVTSPLKYLLFN